MSAVESPFVACERADLRPGDFCLVGDRLTPAIFVRNRQGALSFLSLDEDVKGFFNDSSAVLKLNHPWYLRLPADPAAWSFRYLEHSALSVVHSPLGTYFVYAGGRSDTYVDVTNGEIVDGSSTDGFFPWSWEVAFREGNSWQVVHQFEVRKPS